VKRMIAGQKPTYPGYKIEDAHEPFLAGHVQFWLTTAPRRNCRRVNGSRACLFGIHRPATVLSAPPKTTQCEERDCFFFKQRAFFVVECAPGPLTTRRPRRCLFPRRHHILQRRSASPSGHFTRTKNRLGSRALLAPGFRFASPTLSTCRFN